MIGKWGFSLLPFYLGIIPIFANNNYTLTSSWFTMLKEHFLKEQNIYYILQIDSNPVLQNELPRIRIDPPDPA